MASIRRTLSPIARPSTIMNGEACTTASPLSKTSSSPCNSNHQQSRSLLSSCISSLDYAFYRAQTCLFTVFSPRSKSMRKSWRKSLIHFVVSFFLGAFIGLISIVSSNSSLNLFSQHHTSSIEILKSVDRIQFYSDTSSVTEKLSMNDSVTSKFHLVNAYSFSNSNNSLVQVPNVSHHHKFLIIVTPTYARPLQAYYLNRLARTLKLVPPPILWIVIEMSSQSLETAELLRNSGIMYRHLVCSENLTVSKNKDAHLLNVALIHIEMHHLDGITYFAYDDNVYALEVFEQMRQIRWFGTWIMGKFVERKSEVIVDGPICNGSRVLGWYKNNVTEKLCRFHAYIGGFAFNSTVLWDPKRWNQTTRESIRLLDTVKDGDYVCSFIEQIVEDETQMEGFPSNCSRVMVWHHNFAQFEIHDLLNSAKNGLLQNGRQLAT